MKKNLLCVVMVLLFLVAGVTLGCEPSARSQAIMHVNRGAELANGGKIDEAIAEFDKAIDLDPSFFLAYYDRGMSYQNKGLYNLAIADYTKAAELDPNDVAAKNSRDQLTAHIGETGGQTSTTPRVTIFPSESTFDIGRFLLLYPSVNGIPIRINEQNPMTNWKYKVEWFLDDGAKPISTEVNLEEGPFLEAIGNNPGTYIVKVKVTDRATPPQVVGTAQAKVTAKGKTFIVAPPIHLVSATPGKGLRFQDVAGPWWEGDADLRVQGTIGTLTFTYRATSFPKEWNDSCVGTAVTIAIKNWKATGLGKGWYTYDFTFGDEQVYTAHLDASPDRPLLGYGHAPQTTVHGPGGVTKEGVPQPTSGIAPETNCTFNLVPAP